MRLIVIGCEPEEKLAKRRNTELTLSREDVNTKHHYFTLLIWMPSLDCFCQVTERSDSLCNITM